MSENVTSVLNATVSSVKQTTTTSTVLTVLLYIAVLIIILENILIIVLIQRTPSLKSYTGTLLTNLTTSDSAFMFALATRYFPADKLKLPALGKVVDDICYMFEMGFNGITMITAAAMSFNLSLAVCHSNRYRTEMKTKYVTYFVILSWILGLVLPFIITNSRTTKTNEMTGDVISVYTSSNVWVFVTTDVVMYGIPSLTSALSFYKIWKYARKTQSIPASNLHLADKLKLTKLICGTAVCYLLFGSISRLFRVLYGVFGTSDLGGALQVLWIISNICVAVYHLFKLGIYVVLYPSLRRSLASMMPNVCSRRVVNSQVIDMNDGH